VRLRKCRFVNMGPFLDWILDLTRFRDDQKLIALVGKNGRGKSAAMELAFLGACYLNTPTQGRLANRATAADSMIESTIVYAGREWTLRHTIDAVHGGSNSVVLDESGSPLWKKAGSRQFADWAERTLPQRSVIEASLFRYQSSEGFVQMESGPRIAVLLRVIGVERLERKAKIARENEAAEQKKLDDLLRRIEDVRGGDQGVEASEAALNAALEADAGAAAALAEAKVRLSSAQEGAAAHAVRKASRSAADILLTMLRDQLTAAQGRKADAELRLAGNRQFQAEAVEIRAAAAGLEAANAELTRLEIAVAETDKAIRAELDPWRDGAARLKAAEQRRAAAAARLKDEGAIRKANDEKDSLAAVAAAAKAAVTKASAKIETLQANGWAGAAERITGLRSGLTEVTELPGERVDEAAGVARAALRADDAAVTAATETPKQISELRTHLASERDHLAVAERRLADAERLAARLADLESAKADQDAAGREATEICSGHAVAVLSAVLRALGRRELATDVAAKAEALKVTRKMAGRLAPLDESEKRIVELEQAIATATAEITRAEAQIAAVEVVEIGDAPDVVSAQGAVVDAENAVGIARGNVIKAEQALAGSRAVGAKLDELLGQRADVEAELGDWARLAIDHGRSGLQSDEVDAAGPELTGYINATLRHCVGTRWTMSVETQKLDAEGKNLIDKCTIQVIDNLKGTVREVKEHSGGERTSLAEAIASGLTILGCKRAGFDRPTLFRDESANFLDEEAAPLWIKMMRYVVEFTNADRLLFVSHNSDVRRLADAEIEIPDQRCVEPQSETPQAA
jgi:exonuclease SbcC